MKIRHRLRPLCLAAACATMLAFAGRAPALEDPVHWTSSGIPQKQFRPGATFTAKLVARIDSGWHLYALEQEEGGPISTEISLAGQSVLTLGAVRASKPIQLFDSNFNKRVSLYVDKAAFDLPLKVAASAPSGPQRIAIHVHYQCCNESMCLPPRTAAVDLAVTVKAKR
jgi:thiol:disulfide interchange protein DsbD